MPSVMMNPDISGTCARKIITALLKCEYIIVRINPKEITAAIMLSLTILSLSSLESNCHPVTDHPFPILIDFKSFFMVSMLD